MAERDVTVMRGRDGGGVTDAAAPPLGRPAAMTALTLAATAAAVGVASTGGVSRGAIVGVRPPSGGHVLQRASVGDSLKP